jgi:hypothetical protein
MSKQETVSFEKLEEPCRELKYYQLFGQLKEEVAMFRQTVGHIFIPRLCTIRSARCNSLCTHVPTLWRRKYLTMLLPLISPQSCDDGGGDDDVLHDDP